MLKLTIDLISACMAMDTADKSDIVEQGPRLKSEIKQKQQRISYHKKETRPTATWKSSTFAKDYY